MLPSVHIWLMIFWSMLRAHLYSKFSKSLPTGFQKRYSITSLFFKVKFSICTTPFNTQKKSGDILFEIFLVNNAVAVGSFTISNILHAVTTPQVWYGHLFSLVASFWSKIDLAMPTTWVLSNILQLPEPHLLK